MESPVTQLVHKLNNLLGVIFTQVEVARRATDERMRLDALARIEDAAQRVEVEVKRMRLTGREQAGGEELGGAP